MLKSWDSHKNLSDLNSSGLLLIACLLFKLYIPLSIKWIKLISFLLNMSLGWFLLRHSPPCFPGSLVGKNLPVNAGDMGYLPGSGRSSGEGSGNPLQHSSLENPKDRRACWGPWGHKRVRHNWATKQQQVVFPRKGFLSPAQKFDFQGSLFSFLVWVLNVACWEQ